MDVYDFRDTIRAISELLDGAFRTATIDTTWAASEGAAGLLAPVTLAVPQLMLPAIAVALTSPLAALMDPATALTLASRALPCRSA